MFDWSAKLQRNNALSSAISRIASVGAYNYPISKNDEKSMKRRNDGRRKNRQGKRKQIRPQLRTFSSWSEFATAHIPVTAFSETDTSLVWIYCEFRPQQKTLWPITRADLKIDRELVNFIMLFLFCRDVPPKTAIFFLIAAFSCRPTMTYLAGKEALN